MLIIVKQKFTVFVTIYQKQTFKIEFKNPYPVTILKLPTSS